MSSDAETMDDDASFYSKNLHRECSTILDLPPSCMEFVPVDRTNHCLQHSDHHQYFVVGTYHLQDSTLDAPETTSEDTEDTEDGTPPTSKPQKRDGSLNLFRIQDKQLTLVRRLPFPAGILDLHFIRHSYGGRSIFVVASSVGTISFFDLERQPPEGSSEDVPFADYTMGFIHLATHQICPADRLVLSITWVPTNHISEVPMLLATLNTGEVHLFQFPDENFAAFSIANEGLPLVTHGGETWTSAVCPTLEHVYSGGDDIKLEMVEVNLGEINKDPTAEIRIDKSSYRVRGHEAGITAILPLPFSDARVFLTGSYDDHIRAYSVTPTGQAKLISDLNLGGGVWRLRFLDEHSLRESTEFPGAWRVLASCMHGGARIVEIRHESEDSWAINVIAWVKEHKSMSYASDVQPLTESRSEEGVVGGNSERLCVSTSFYDKLLVVWSYNPTIDAL
ncbi:hypothetical protein BJ875DRAFT_58991 [Amylocarpus encephaloides]|uniref:Uncharacterized protein n=1 Tax=Amylocarpus encephaloides TaxID=45428 RepID=A0A9P8C5I8_9HELO|nr:hypothetical protein BJ875DRAFT_58991 [Amylocarpus encephaloides]